MFFGCFPYVRFAGIHITFAESKSDFALAFTRWSDLQSEIRESEPNKIRPLGNADERVDENNFQRDTASKQAYHAALWR